MNLRAWQFVKAGEPFVCRDIPFPTLGPGDVLVRIVGCGVCHTDLGFVYDGVPTVKALPLTLGHEISGMVEEAGANVRSLQGKAVIVPAVLPCGECDLCQKGRRSICRNQKMPGNHIDGGFASHIAVPARYLCVVPVENEKDAFGRSGVSLRELSVIADAVTTPYQAVKNSHLTKGDLAIFVGAGGVGGFGIQIASALGAAVVAIDVDDARLAFVSKHGARVTYNAKSADPKTLRKEIQKFAAGEKLSPFEWKIFETSGSSAGQQLAFSLLTFGATLAVVGYTTENILIRLSNLMAYDARAIGNWGCDPQLYPEVLELVRTGKIEIGPFVEVHPMQEIGKVFEAAHGRKLTRRAVLVPPVG